MKKVKFTGTIPCFALIFEALESGMCDDIKIRLKRRD